MLGENPDFSEALEKLKQSFSGLPTVHNAYFRSALKFIVQEEIPFDKACDEIGKVIGQSRKEVETKLMNCRPSQPDASGARDRFYTLGI